ncbi:hypothetical protein RD792_003569 [Penstemon davidsonii]|uniref:Folylpolyglutamate synthase n=1 Tax=Penstemon davidsonii TaxID=160366 RepID=A0ABR0DF14_9LAMI|nr:hypothetical protein RD792_003569 [Penstemon davidsonii]
MCFRFVWAPFDWYMDPMPTWTARVGGLVTATHRSGSTIQVGRNTWGEQTSDELPMPTYFRFLALLAFKIFAAEQVDVAILEVGLGGKFDATNVVESPVVCGIASLGYDHMEILGNTLGQIAGGKGWDFPAFTVPQPEEAMSVLEEKASKLEVPLQVAAPLDPNVLSGLRLGLEGEHQYLNAGLAIALCSTWLQRTGRVGINYLNQTTSLPDEFIKGLATASLQGRAQIVPDQLVESDNPDDLVFYLDGAHSPESMDVCAKWFSLAIKEDRNSTSKALHDSGKRNGSGTSRQSSTQVMFFNHYIIYIWKILLFNCMSVRDPQLLLPRLMNACASHGVHFNKALFVPNTSVYYKVGTGVSPPADAQVDLSFQLTLQRIWESLVMGERGKEAKNADLSIEAGVDDTEKGGRSCENSTVFPSLPLAINWLRDNVRKNQSVRVQECNSNQPGSTRFLSQLPKSYLKIEQERRRKSNRQVVEKVEVVEVVEKVEDKQHQPISFWQTAINTEELPYAERHNSINQQISVFTESAQRLSGSPASAASVTKLFRAKPFDIKQNSTLQLHMIPQITRKTRSSLTRTRSDLTHSLENLSTVPLTMEGTDKIEELTTEVRNFTKDLEAKQIEWSNVVSKFENMLGSATAASQANTEASNIVNTSLMHLESKMSMLAGASTPLPTGYNRRPGQGRPKALLTKARDQRYISGEVDQGMKRPTNRATDKLMSLTRKEVPPRPVPLFVNPNIYGQYMPWPNTTQGAYPYQVMPQPQHQVMPQYQVMAPSPVPAPLPVQATPPTVEPRRDQAIPKMPRQSQEGTSRSNRIRERSPDRSPVRQVRSTAYHRDRTYGPSTKTTSPGQYRPRTVHTPANTRVGRWVPVRHPKFPGNQRVDQMTRTQYRR